MTRKETFWCWPRYSPAAGHTTSWREFWNGENSIYVNLRHRVLHDRLVARDIVAFLPCREATVLDYGCGKTTAAEDVADHCSTLILCDAAPDVRLALAERYGDHPKITVVSLEDIRELSPQSIDAIVLNSVLQYISRVEFEELLGAFRLLLKNSGVLVIGDVIRPENNTLADAAALLHFGLKGGFFVSAVLEQILIIRDGILRR